MVTQVKNRLSPAPIRWWPAALTLGVVGVAYTLLSGRLTLGPPGLILALAGVAFVSASVLGRLGLYEAGRIVVLTTLSMLTLAVVVSTALLVVELTRGNIPPLTLLRDAAVLWSVNMLTFTLWYWELDGGGPAHRRPGARASTDFVFPQQQVPGDDRAAADWVPELLDYLFVAFNASAAFGPTDTLVMARRAKVLMMLQSLVSLVTIIGLAARAIGSLASS